MYHAMFRTVSAADMTVHVTFLSKTETMVRGLLGDDPRYPGWYGGNALISNLVRFIRREFTAEDYAAVSKMSDADEFKRYVIGRLRAFHKGLRGGPRNASAQRGIPKLIRALRETEFELDVREKYPMPYDVSFGWIDEFMKDRGQDGYRLYIDGEYGLYPEESLIGIEHEYVDSEDGIGIRVCDHIAGFVSKMLWAIENEISGQEETVYEGMGYLPVLGKEWFDLREEAYDTYRYLGELLSRDGGMSAVTTSHWDANLILYLLLRYMEDYADHGDYASFPPE